MDHNYHDLCIHQWCQWCPSIADQASLPSAQRNLTYLKSCWYPYGRVQHHHTHRWSGFWMKERSKFQITFPVIWYHMHELEVRASEVVGYGQSTCWSPTGNGHHNVIKVLQQTLSQWLCMYCFIPRPIPSFSVLQACKLGMGLGMKVMYVQ